MASYRIEFKRSAERDLRKLYPARIPDLLKEIEALSENPFPRRSLKLSGAERTYRLRVGTYRVIYEVDPGSETLTIHYIRHRKEAYRQL